jgi:hypothetical protein
MINLTCFNLPAALSIASVSFVARANILGCMDLCAIGILNVAPTILNCTTIHFREYTTIARETDIASTRSVECTILQLG